MHAAGVDVEIAGALPVLGVLLGGMVIGIAIAAWLAREVAIRAIEKSAPDHVADVISALAVLISAFRCFLPWNRMHGRDEWSSDTQPRRPQHNEVSPPAPKEHRHETRHGPHP